MTLHIIRIAIRLAACAAVLVLVCPVIAAETPTRSLEEVERDLATARAAERRIAAEAEAQIRDIEALRARLSTAAQETQESEDTLSSLELRLSGLDAEEAARSGDLERRRGELAGLLNALQRLARHPPEALALLPADPVDTIRTAKLLGAVVPPIEAMAKDLAREVDDIRTLRAVVQAERAGLTAALAKHEATQGRLRELVARRSDLYRHTEVAYGGARERVQSLGRQAADLRDLLRRLDETRDDEKRRAVPGPAPSRPSSVQSQVAEALAGKVRRLGDARGQMAAPVRGQVVLGFGQTGEGGQPHRGLSIQTRPEAQIVAPFDGQIVFAGPFRGYGHILIIEHAEGYHTLLAGLGRIDVSVGQIVATGEPVATTGPADAEGSADAGSRGVSGAVLYVELRRHGQPINPQPWLALNGKVSG